MKKEMASIEKSTDYAEYLLVRILAGLINAFPFQVSTFLTSAVGTLFYYLLPKRREIALQNLNIAYGSLKTPAEKRRIAKAVFVNLALSMMEFFRVGKTLAQAGERFHFRGTEHLDRAFAKGKGVVLVISHLGSWEYLGFLPYLKKYPCSVVGRPVRNPYIYGWIRSLRQVTGLNHLDKTNSIKTILSELKKNHLVAILIDQWAGKEGIRSNFFGFPTSTTSIPARLARKTGAAMIPAYCLRKGNGQFEIQIKPEIPLCGNSHNWEQRTTEELNRQLETQILLYPDQWTWTHRRWKSLELMERSIQPEKPAESETVVRQTLQNKARFTRRYSRIR